jgi:type IV pilus assembly protein PilO
MKNVPWLGHLVIALVILAAAFFLYFKPQNQKIADIRAERVKTETEVMKLRQQKMELDKIEAQIVSLTAQLKDLEQIIPDRKEIAEILRQIQQLAYDARLDVIRFAPQTEVNREFYSEWPIPIQVTGNYHNLGQFFDRLSQYPRLFTIDKFSLKALSRQTDLATISADWTVKTFFFVEAPVKAKTPAAKQARPK